MGARARAHAVSGRARARTLRALNPRVHTTLIPTTSSRCAFEKVNFTLLLLCPARRSRGQTISRGRPSSRTRVCVRATGQSCYCALPASGDLQKPLENRQQQHNSHAARQCELVASCCMQAVGATNNERTNALIVQLRFVCRAQPPVCGCPLLSSSSSLPVLSFIKRARVVRAEWLPIRVTCSLASSLARSLARSKVDSAQQ